MKPVQLLSVLVCVYVITKSVTGCNEVVIEVDELDKGNIWSNFMRMHFVLNICHFLQSVVSITEGPKTKL